MDITSPLTNGKNIINAYSDEGFTVSEQKLYGSIILTSNLVKEISIKANEINSDKMLSVLFDNISNEIETLLIGTGKNHQRLSPEIRQKIKEKNISVDEMTSAAACRTFNVLTLEDRKVAAILLI